MKIRIFAVCSRELCWQKNLRGKKRRLWWCWHSQLTWPKDWPRCRYYIATLYYRLGEIFEPKSMVQQIKFVGLRVEIVLFDKQLLFVNRINYLKCVGFASLSKGKGIYFRFSSLRSFLFSIWNKIYLQMSPCNYRSSCARLQVYLRPRKP